MTDNSTVKRAAAIFGIVIAIALLAGTWTAAAKSTGTGPKTEKEVFSGVCFPDPVDKSVATPYESYFNAFGDEGLCAVFEAQWCSFYIGMDYLPSCTGDSYEVMCLTDTGEWTANDVEDVALSADGTVLMGFLAQDGHCGIFNVAGASGVDAGVVSGQ